MLVMLEDFDRWGGPLIVPIDGIEKMWLDCSYSDYNIYISVKETSSNLYSKVFTNKKEAIERMKYYFKEIELAARIQRGEMVPTYQLQEKL